MNHRSQPRAGRDAARAVCFAFFLFILAAGGTALAQEDVPAFLDPSLGEPPPSEIAPPVIDPGAESPDQMAPGSEAVESPDRITAPANPRPGVYCIEYGTLACNPATTPADGAIRFYGWSALNPSPGVYNWTDFNTWLASRKGIGLGTGIMITTYDGSTAGDIRSTPDYVIKTADTVIPATSKANATAPELPHYVNYWKRSTYNSNFDGSPSNYLWTLSGNTSIVAAPAGSSGNAGKLGGVNNATGSIYHLEERIPAMPSSLDGTQRASIEANVYIDTADTGANDHLYVELWDTSNNKIGGTQLDITNLSHTNKTWKIYTWDVSNIALEKKIRVAFRVTTNGTNISTFYVDSVKIIVRHVIPKYWSDAYFNAYKTFIDALGANYKNNPDLQFVAMGTGVYGENQPTQSDSYPDSHFDHVVQNAGLTSAGWTAYMNRVSDAYAAAFNTVTGQPPNRGVMLQFAPTYLSVQEREDSTVHAGQQGVGLSANFLSPDWTQAFKNDRTGMYDSVIEYGDTVPIAFESYVNDLCSPVLVYWAVAHALDKHTDFLRAEAGLVTNANHTSIYDWASTYLGKTAETTPKAWVLMREHRNPIMTSCRSGGAFYQSSANSSYWPQLGNFHFYLIQSDAITGGKTVPETNDKGVDSRYARIPGTSNAAPDAGLGNCPSKTYREDLFGLNYPCNPQPYNSNLPPLVGQNPDDPADYYLPADWTGAGKEAYTVRRTDQATGNPFMFFLADNSYIPGSGTYEAVITVKYFDIGTDKWSLKYDSTTGEKSAGTITKTGTKALMTATFTVTDGRFAGRLTGGADFYIDSRNPSGNSNDGNEWIHLVEIERRTALSAPQSPVLSAGASGANLELAWPAVTQDQTGGSTVVDHYDVWRDPSPYFNPNPTGTPYARVFQPGFEDVGVLGQAGGLFYLATAVNTSPSAVSNRSGKFTYSLLGGQ